MRLIKVLRCRYVFREEMNSLLGSFRLVLVLGMLHTCMVWGVVVLLLLPLLLGLGLLIVQRLLRWSAAVVPSWLLHHHLNLWVCLRHLDLHWGVASLDLRRVHRRRLVVRRRLRSFALGSTWCLLPLRLMLLLMLLLIVLLSGGDRSLVAFSLGFR